MLLPRTKPENVFAGAVARNDESPESRQGSEALDVHDSHIVRFPIDR